MDYLLSAQNFVSIITLLAVVHVILGTVTVLIYFERKISAYIQDRLGPNRTGFSFGVLPIKFGFWGLGQSLADGLKFLLKEDYAPSRVDKALFTLAPIAIIVPALIGFAVIPWGGFLTVPDIQIGDWLLVKGGTAQVIGANINIGFVYLLAVASLGVYGVALGGWASNNKYSFLGGLRATAGMISYEIPLGAAILTVILLSGTVRPDEIVQQQAAGAWFVFSQPLAAIIFFVCILAEANRAPFDNAEAEQELVGGYHTEYSSMRFALYFLAEYAHMITSSAFLAVLFFGGYQLLPFINDPFTSPEAFGLLPALVKFSVLFGKIITIIVLMMFVRWTIPRIRYDQVLKIAWGGMIPVSIVLVVATAVWVAFGWTAIWQMLILNALVLAGTMAVMPLMPKDNVNKRIRLAGSRFSPLRDEDVRTAPTSAAALREGA
jgi:NADH-quinone oxidoreductase subunit H